MRKNAERRNGFTLSELAVVLALVAIASVAVTSFCLIVQKRSVISRARLDIVNEVNTVEIYIERWVDEISESGANFNVNGKDKLSTDLKINDTDNFCTATFSNGVFVGRLPDGETITYNTTQVESLSFECRTDGDGDRILFCTVNAFLPQTDGENKTEKYTFCINSRIGEKFGEVSQ